MKKTLMITLEFPPTQGGIATYVSGMAEHLPANDLVVLAPPGDDSTPHNYTLYRRPLLGPRFLWPRWATLVMQVRNSIKRDKIEQIYVHHVLPVGYVAFLMKKIYHIPYSVFLHGADVTTSTQTAWKRGWSERLLLAAEKVVCNSASLEARVVALFPLLAGRTRVLYPCPSDQVFERVDAAKRDKLKDMLALSGRRVIVTVSRLAEGKGLPHLMHLIPDMVARIPNLAWLLVGSGPKQAFLADEIQRLGLQNVVRMVGGIPQEQIPLYVSLGDVFVLLTHPDATRGEEGFGLVFVEAAALGLPVVAGESGGVRETMMPGTTGIMVSPSAASETIQTIVDLMNDPARRSQMGQAGAAWAAQTFRWDIQLAKLSE